MEKTVLDEFFGLLPGGLHKVGSSGEYDIYSNDRIKSVSTEKLSEHPSTRRIIKAINNGIETNRIMIGYSSQSFTSHIFRRLKDWNAHRPRMTEFGKVLQSYKKPDPVILGGFDRQQFNVTILLDRNVSLMGEIFEDIPPIITHELCHMACSNDINSFFTATKDRFLIPFFSSFLNQIIEKDIDPALLADHLKKIMYLSESRHSAMDEKFISKIGQEWKKFFLDTGFDTKKAEYYSVCIFLPFFHFVGEKSLSTVEKNILKDVMVAFYKAYKEIGYSDAKNYTLACQEVVYPSEIVCITNQFSLSSQAASVINKIKF